MGLFGVRDASVQLTFKGKDQVSPVVRGIKNTMAGFKRDAMTGFGLGAGISVFNLAERGIRMVTDALGDAARAAIEDEKSVAQLTTTLRNNVKEWDGHTDAIDEAIKKAQDLAFADDEVRGSLNLLIPRTHDIAEAIKLLGLSEDLARFKSLSLEEATGLVGKAYSGQTTALRRAGIAIDANATSTEALAQLQRQVSGQAKRYGETTEGQMKAAQIAIDEAWEAVGYRLLPVMEKLATFTRDVLVPAITLVGDALDIVGQVADDWVKGVSLDISEGQRNLNRQLAELGVQLPGELAGGMRTGGRAVTGAWGEISGDLLDRAGALVTGIGAKLDPLAGIMKGSIKNARIQAEREMADLVWALKHPLSAARLEEVYQNELDDAYKKLHQAQHRGNVVAIAKAQHLVDVLKAKIAEIQSAELTLIPPVIVPAVPPPPPGVFQSGYDAETGPIYSRHRGHRGHRGHRASGGSVEAGGAYLVGERGPEVLQMGNKSGRINPNGGTIRNVIYLDGRVIYDNVNDRLGRDIAMNGSA